MLANNQRQVKIVIAGNFGAGKRSLIHRFCQESFQQDITKTTVGFDFTTKSIVIDGMRIPLRIYGTAGQERYNSSPPSYFREADGIILTYDITDAKSFEELGTWIEKINNAGGGDATKILIGNKKDDEARRIISTQRGQMFADNHQMRFFETSAMLDDNVTEAFYHLVREINNTILGNNPVNNRVGLNNNNNHNANQGSGCCGGS